MARQAKRRLSFFFSIITSFALSLFSGGAHAGPAAMKTGRNVSTGNSARSTGRTGNMSAPSPTSASSRSVGRTGNMSAPSPTSASSRSAGESLGADQFADENEQSDFQSWAGKNNLPQNGSSLTLFRTERDAADVMDHVQQMKQEMQDGSR